MKTLMSFLTVLPSFAVKDLLIVDLIPENKLLEDILIKVSTLNDFYSTNIFSIFYRICIRLKHFTHVNIIFTLSILISAHCSTP